MNWIGWPRVWTRFCENVNEHQCSESDGESHELTGCMRLRMDSAF